MVASERESVRRYIWSRHHVSDDPRLLSATLCRVEITTGSGQMSRASLASKFA